MKTNFLITFIALMISLTALPQKIDSLKKILPKLTDTARIDCLHELGVQYLFKPNKDSTLYYTNILYEESEKINYTHGLAVTYILKGAIANHFYNDFFQMELMAREAINWFNKSSNKKDMEIAYWQLGRSLTNQSDYDGALYNCKISYELSKKVGREQVMEISLETMTDIYRERGEYDKLLEAQQKIIQMERRSDDQQAYTIHELWVMGLMYMLLDEYSTALSFWRKLFLESDSGGFLTTWNMTEYAQLLTLANQHDSALYYYNQFDSSKADIKELRTFLVSKGEYFFSLKEYKTALPYFLKGLVYHRQLNDRTQIKRTLLDIAKTYEALQKNDSAISYARQGLNMALQTNSKPSIREGYKILYSLYSRLHSDSASHYFLNYINMKEAVMNNQTRGKLAAYKFEHQIRLLDKEKQLQQQQLKQAAQQKTFFVISIAAILLLGLIIFRNVMLKRKNEIHLRKLAQNEQQLQKLESEKKQEELQHKATQLEIQALRAQMNPHFIFNCLSSINRFILKNESESASDYLTKFSRLIRMVLNNSKKESIALDDELEMLRLYLEMERMRFKYSFNYNISFKNEIDPENIFIPPLLLQPFAENAIWHGLLNKVDRGHLTVLLSKETNMLSCMIEDNGVGRAKAAEVKSKSAERNKSLGLQITKERLALLNGDSNQTTFLEVEDLYNDKGNAIGTRVILKIRLPERFGEHSLIS